MYELQVEGMSCNHCVSKVTSCVKRVDPVAKVQVDLTSGKVRVESTAEREEVSAAIEDAGYVVTA
jgi:copper ion binding protein